MYVHWQRQYLHPWLLAFDAPTREECTADRPISSTPTAALVLLNDPSFVEAARALAAKILAQAPADDDRANSLGLAAGARARRRRRPRANVLAKLLDKHRTQYAADAKAAEAIRVGRHFAAAEGCRRGRAGGMDVGQPRAVESERNDYAQLSRSANGRSSATCRID